MPRILKRPRAQTDLAEIWEFIAEDSQARADSFLDRLDQSFYGLAVNPHIGRTHGELCPDLRSFPVCRHVIFYLALADGIEICPRAAWRARSGRYFPCRKLKPLSRGGVHLILK